MNAGTGVFFQGSEIATTDAIGEMLQIATKIVDPGGSGTAHEIAQGV